MFGDPPGYCADSVFVPEAYGYPGCVGGEAQHEETGVLVQIGAHLGQLATLGDFLENIGHLHGLLGIRRGRGIHEVRERGLRRRSGTLARRGPEHGGRVANEDAASTVARQHGVECRRVGESRWR